jgi:phosphoglycolate phosphatase-like HAD superfamily hydrolase
MPQAGSHTVITKEIKLIILDCFETLVELAGQTYRPRKGVVPFLEHFRSVRKLQLAVASDSDERSVLTALNTASLLRFFSRIYHAENAMEALGDGRTRKRLDLPVADFALKPEEVIFIGDSPLDAEAAAFHHIPFIRVPRSEDRSFSFTLLIGGPSRYDSAEFSAAFLEQYLADNDKDGKDKKP